MIRLSAITKTLVLTCSANCTVYVSGSEKSSTAYAGFDQETAATSGGSPNTISAAPAASAVKDHDTIRITNTNAGANTITPAILNSVGPVTTQLGTWALAQGDVWEYTHGSGVKVMDSNGNIKVGSQLVIGASVFGGTATRVLYVGAGPVLADSANMTFDGTKLTVAGLKDSALTSGRVPYATTGGELIDAANLTFDGTKLTAAGIKDSALTSGRVTFAGTSGELSDDADLTFSTDTLTVTKLTVSSNPLTVGAGGTGATNAVGIFDGSSASGQGSAITFRRNGSTKGYIGTESFVLGGTSDNITINASANIVLKPDTSIVTIQDDSQLFLKFNKTNTGQVWRFQTDLNATDDFGIYDETHTAQVVSFSTVAGGVSKVRFATIGTTGTAANAVIDNTDTNSLLRSTSSLRYKENVEALTMDEARTIVMKSEPIKYSHLGDNRNHIGFAAEKIALVDYRLITRDRFHRPDWVQYPIYAAPLCLIAQDHERRLIELERRAA